MASGTKYARPTILMCPPRYYGIEYEINPWMSRSRQSDSDAARAQWHALYGLLSSLGADLRQLEPAIGLPASTPAQTPPRLRPSGYGTATQSASARHGRPRA